MARRVVRWIANVIREPDSEPQPHFHQGPWSAPAACYDPNCGSPRLDVETG
jgi:hypothetical protein